MGNQITVETKDETVDLGRRDIMARFGLMASVACAAPVLMTISSSAQATKGGNGKNNRGDKANGRSNGNAGGANAGSRGNGGVGNGAGQGATNGQGAGVATSDPDPVDGGDGGDGTSEDDPIVLGLF